MSGINTNHTIYLKVLTPVHIGGAQEKHLQEGLDFLVLDNTTWKINWEVVFAEFDPGEIAESIIDKKKLVKILQPDIEKYAIEMDRIYGTTGEVKAFVKDGLGRAYIPGSSIKGAMKNWLYAAIDPSSKGTRNLFGSFETDLFRFIKPSDCYMDENVVMYPTKTFNLHKRGNAWEGGWKHSPNSNSRRPSTDDKFKDSGFVTDYECFEIGDLGTFTLSIQNISDSFKQKLYDDEIRRLQNKNKDSSSVQNGKEMQRKLFENSPLWGVFENVNSQVKKHIERELAFFEEYKNAEGVRKIIETFESLKHTNQNLDENQCVIRLSAGSGFHGITGDYQFEDHINTGVWSQEDAKKYKLSRNQQMDYVNRYVKFKSRKIAFTSEGRFPMGFVLLSTSPFQ